MSVDTQTWFTLVLVIRLTVISLLELIEGHEYISPNTFQQPRVAWSAPKNEYVMWWHVDNAERDLLLLGLATSSSIEGPYKFVSANQSPASTSEDFGLFTDYKTGKSYGLYNVGPGAAGGHVFHG